MLRTKLLLIFLFIGGSIYAQQSYHRDLPFIQEYSIKYFIDDASTPSKVFSDRNNNIKALTSQGVIVPTNGRFLYPGTFAPDRSYRTSSKKQISAITTVQDQFVFADGQTLFSQAWAGKVFIKTPFENPTLLAADTDFNFLISDGTQWALLNQQKVIIHEKLNAQKILDLKYNRTTQQFYILTNQGIYTSSIKNPKLQLLLKGQNFTSFDLTKSGETFFIGSTEGYFRYHQGSTTPELFTKIPSAPITSIKIIDDRVWFGTLQGTFSVQPDQTINYYFGERWLPSNQVIHIEAGPDQSVLILTQKGLGQIMSKPMTLEQKAAYYDRQVRSRHIRNGFNATLSGLKNGNLSGGFLSDSDNDGLWTSMYLGAEVFRYASTGSTEALQNIRESLDAMERLYTINPVPGFPARSFERSGSINVLSDPERWQHASNKEWDWKSTTSSDEAIGHAFVYGVIAELVDVPEIKNQAIQLIDTLMSHIIKNDMYLVDFDGKPTLWGKWNPSYVNGFPTNVGDRKLNSSNITAMLQTAYHFTKKEKYKTKAMELLYQHGYLENLMRPMKEIGSTPAGSDAYAQMLSEAWNHSDDEMYYLGYWGLYRYAFTDELRAKYKAAILDHWQAERPEKDGLWNIMTALTEVDNFDLDAAIWYLQKYPLDLIQWDVQNSHRKDIELLPTNFRTQTTKTVIPPDERPVRRHNANTFILDKMGSNGTSELSAGDIWLLPYWMGRYLGVISEPAKN